MAFHRILVGIDFSPGSRHAVARARSLASAFDAELVLLHVVAPLDLLPPRGAAHLAHVAEEATARAVAAARKKLSKVETAVRRKHGRARSLVEIGAPAKVIVAQAKRLHADLVVVGTAGRTGLSHFLIGSVAERVVRTSPVPVLAVHGPAARAVAKPVAHEPRTVTLI